MKNLNLICMLMAVISLGACRTSSDVVRGKDYVDPTDVKTEEESAANPVSKRESSSSDELKRQLAIVQGENESLKVVHNREMEVLSQKITTLENENRKLKDQHSQIQEIEDAKPKNAADQWLLALKQVEKQNYEKSAESFGDLIRNYSKSPWVFHSYLGRALSLYGAGEYKDAALVFNQVIDRFPKKREVSLAWLGQGASFHRMGQKQDAKLFFSEIVTRFPKSDEAAVARKIVENKRQPPADLFVAFPGWAKYAPQPQE